MIFMVSVCTIVEGAHGADESCAIRAKVFKAFLTMLWTTELDLIVAKAYFHVFGETEVMSLSTAIAEHLKENQSSASLYVLLLIQQTILCAVI